MELDLSSHIHILRTVTVDTVPNPIYLYANWKIASGNIFDCRNMMCVCVFYVCLCWSGCWPHWSFAQLNHHSHTMNPYLFLLVSSNIKNNTTRHIQRENWNKINNILIYMWHYVSVSIRSRLLCTVTCPHSTQFVCTITLLYRFMGCFSHIPICHQTRQSFELFHGRRL